jgi:hypothetical protein
MSAGVDRRRVLLGIGGLAATGMAGVTALTLQAGRAWDGPAGSVLTQEELGIVAALVEVFCPAVPGLPGGLELDVPSKVDALLAANALGVGQEVKQVLALLESPLVGLVLDGRATPFSSSSAEVRQATLLSWQQSDLALRRTAFKALRALCLGSYWSDPRVWRHCGYPGPTFVEGEP